jgi:trehalose 6-phosphate phosphatase
MRAQPRAVDPPPPPPDLLVGASLLLDFDGTLVEIAERPDAIVVDARLTSLIDRLSAALPGRVAIVSGRALDEIDRLIGAGSLAIGGSHGVELRLPDGRRSGPRPPAGLAQVVAAMRELQAVHPLLVVEEKPFGAALHYRTAPEAEAACRSLAAELAGRDGWALQEGKMVAEVRAAGQDKGAALRTLMREPPMLGTVPVFIGDDHTDETAFAAATELGGAGILVGPPRPTAALYRLDDVSAVRAWLLQAAGESA